MSDPQTVNHDSRREFLQTGWGALLASTVLFPISGCHQNAAVASSSSPSEQPSTDDPTPAQEKSGMMKVHYLEIVTPEVAATCKRMAEIHGVTFSEARPELGGARTTKLPEGGMLGIRAPLRDSETPVVRPYFLVKDIQKAVEQATASGAQIAMAPTPISDRGQFAILVHGGIESGLWQV